MKYIIYGNFAVDSDFGSNTSVAYYTTISQENIF